LPRPLTLCSRPSTSIVPVKMIVHPQPGLYGAAAAFANEHRS
jgi:glucokinase